jgi:hypothetical protein
MPAPPKKDPNAIGKPYNPGEPLPKPDVVEKNSDTAWAMFQAIQDGTHEEFPSTSRDTLDLPVTRGPKEKAIKPLTDDEVMFEARRNNRVCPMPSHWLQLHQILQQHGAGAPPPVDLSAWQTTPPLEKRTRLRSQVDWAAEHGALEPMFTFFRALPEDQWHHMGD